ncbi:hypothetical protein [Xenorhabdus cabanillasii]|uniref:Orphan protein n=1 Tax=Xenorhabdus cabanillasii JM26 TaxID=1427517 RepID=W1IR93_9GAMM|nr:hypothetical protein [Xenorhabdus cabanillasii]PHM78424.1 hypothetical protein Xcab_01040 [Xenorhabdus cabanillasii JM26]CDL79750.1 conserved hypothetical protein [Xenorhabdus cabanillasii JM26]
MSIDKSQWAKIAAELQSLFCCIRFKYQDTVISIYREKVSESRTHLVVYFDNKISAAWSNEKSEHYNPLTKLFWRSRTQALYSKSRIADAEKLLGKRHVKQHMSYMYKTTAYLVPLFPNSAALIRQYKKIEGLEWLADQALILSGGEHA